MEKETSVEKMPPRWPSLWCIFLTDDWCGSAQLTVSSAILGLMVLSATRKQAKEAMGSKQYSFMAPLSDGLTRWKVKQAFSFPSNFCHGVVASYQ